MQRLFESDENKTTDTVMLKPGKEWLIDDEEDTPYENNA